MRKYLHFSSINVFIQAHIQVYTYTRYKYTYFKQQVFTGIFYLTTSFIVIDVVYTTVFAIVTIFNDPLPSVPFVFSM